MCIRKAFRNVVYFGGLFAITIPARSSDDLLVHVVRPISATRVLPDIYPLPGVKSKALTVTVCPGEHEPASFVLRAITKSFPSISIEVGNLSAIHGTIRNENIDIKVVKVWYQAGGAWESHRIDRTQSPVLVPELLVNDPALVKVDHTKKGNYLKLALGGRKKYIWISDPSPKDGPDLTLTSEFPVRDAKTLQPAELPIGTNLQYWLTVHIPQDTAAGPYKGIIQISDDRGIPIENIELTIEVLPFKLAGPILEYSIYYRGKLDPETPTVSSEFKSESQLRAELIDLRKHGFNNPTVYQRYRPKGELKPKSLQEVRNLLHQHLSIRHELAMTGGNLYYIGRTTGNPTSKSELGILASDVRDLLGIARKYGFDRLYLYGIDEARGEALRQEQAAWKTVRNLGEKIFAAGSDGHFEEMGYMTDLLIYPYQPKRSEAEKFHRVGHHIYSYGNPQAGPENPLVYRKNYGFGLWQAGFDGAMDYAYQHSMGSIWNDFDHLIYRDPVFAYPTADGVIDTIAWEGFREAIDDIRYLSTLIRLVTLHERKAGHAMRAAVTNAKRFMNDLGKMNDFDPSEVRNRLIALILNLLKAVATLGARDIEVREPRDSTLQ